MYPISPSAFLLSLIVLTSALQSCKKPVKATPLDFFWTIDSANHMQRNFTSTAPAGSIFQWNFGDGSTSTLAEPSHLYDSLGAYDITLTINNNAGNKVQKTITFGRPSFNYGGGYAVVNRNTYYRGSVFNFYATGITGSSFVWVFSEGDSAFTANVSHTYLQPGTFTVRLYGDGKYPGWCYMANSYEPTFTIADTPGYTFHICQTRQWTNGRRRVKIAGGSDTTYMLADTTFALSYINSTTIDRMEYDPQTSSPGISAYTSDPYDHASPSEYLQKMYYYHGSDSITYYVRTRTLTPFIVIEESWNTR